MGLWIFYVISTSIMQYGPHEQLIRFVWEGKWKGILTLGSKGFLLGTPALM